MKNIPFHKPIMPDDLNDIYTDSLMSGWLTTGPEVNKFEANLRNIFSSKNTVCVNSCTAALHLALKAKGFGPDDKLIAPTYTFVATVEVGEYLGMQCELIDCEKDGFNIDLNIVDKSPEEVCLELAKFIKTLSSSDIGFAYYGITNGDENVQNLGQGESYFAIFDRTSNKTKHVRSAGIGIPDKRRAIMSSLSLIRNFLK